MKKLLTVLLALFMCLSLAACSGEQEEVADSGLKIGMVLIGDENEGYSKAHMDGVEKAAAKFGATVSYKKNNGDGSQATYDAEEELIEDGCQLIISNSYGHQSYTQQVASENEDLTFVAMTGDISGTLPNLTCAFMSIYEARYVAGIVAGLKIKELVEAGKLTEENYVSDAEAAAYATLNPNAPSQKGNIKIGYASAFPYAECVSGFTAFYLGVRSVVENVTMLVRYTNDWGDYDLENKASKALIADGCVVISQHADTTGSPTAVEEAHNEGKEVYCVGYNISMLEAAPNSALTSATNNWEVAYSYIIEKTLAGEQLEDFNAGYAQGAVAITDLGDACAKGTADKVAEAEAAIKAGELHVFDTSKFTVGGKTVTDNSCVDAWFIDAIGGDSIYDGYFHESEYRSAPYFAAIIDGIIDIASVVQ